MPLCDLNVAFVGNFSLFISMVRSGAHCRTQQVISFFSPYQEACGNYSSMFACNLKIHQKEISNTWVRTLQAAMLAT